MTKRFFLLFFITSIYSCTSTKSIPERFDSSNENGIFYGLLSFPKEKSYIVTFNLLYKKKDTYIKKKYKQSVHVRNNQKSVFDRTVNFKPDYNNDDEYIYLFAIEVPPGEYEFYQIETTVVNVDTWGTSTSKPFSLDFRVNKGVISYVGNYKFYEKGNDNGAYLEISNNKEKANGYYKHYRKDLNWGNSINETPKFNNNSFIQIK